MTEIIREALHLAEVDGVSGSASTPHVLNSIKRLSGGRSIPANRALVESNVIRGTKVAVELSRLENGIQEPSQHRGNGSLFAMHPSPDSQSRKKAHKQSTVNLLVAGSIAMDLACDFAPNPALSGTVGPSLSTSNPCKISKSIGGVGHNIARAAQIAGGSVRLCSAVANDETGRSILNEVAASGMDIGAIQSLPASLDLSTAQYVSFNDASKNLVMAMADMRLLENTSKLFDEKMIDEYIQSSKPSWLAIDANWDTQTLLRWIKSAKEASVAVAFRANIGCQSAKDIH